MKKILYFLVAVALTAATFPDTPTDTPIKGSWKMVRYQYGKDPMKNMTDPYVSYKTFTGTHWTGAGYNKDTKEITGSCGGTYKLKGNQYDETIEYYSWDPKVAGKTFHFVMTIENDMLHQKGTMEWDGDANYVIDEWYSRVD